MNLLLADTTMNYTLNPSDYSLDDPNSPSLPRNVESSKYLEIQSKLRHAQKMEALGQLVSGVAHDFNNLLTIISGHGELMSMQVAKNDPLRTHIEEISKAAGIAADLTHQLLSFSRNESNELSIVNLNQTIMNLERMIHLLLGEKMQFRTSLDSDLHNIKVNHGQLEQVIINLAINARDAMSEGGLLTMETSNLNLSKSAAATLGIELGSYVMFLISDDGCGMSQETATKAFEPFFTTKKKNNGTGLGLSTVFSIVKQNSGYIGIDSELGSGTTIKIYLPLATEKQSSPELEPEVLPAASENESILVVEDEKGVREMIVRILHSQGYEVISAGSGMEALRICEDLIKAPKLLLTDFVLPDMSGDHLARTAQEIWPEIKVVITSGYIFNNETMPIDEKTGYAFLPKPFSLSDLISRVKEVLASTQFIRC